MNAAFCFVQAVFNPVNGVICCDFGVLCPVHTVYYTACIVKNPDFGALCTVVPSFITGFGAISTKTGAFNSKFKIISSNYFEKLSIGLLES